MMVGYSDSRDFTYRLFIPDEMKVILTREARFDENLSLDLELATRDLSAMIDENIAEPDEIDEIGEATEAYLTVSEGRLTFEQAYKRPELREAMADEYKSLMVNKTWDLAPLPEGKRPITAIWIFTAKTDSKGAIARHKARYVARGFDQVEGIDFDEIFAPVARMDSIRMILALSAKFAWEVIQFDIRTAFLYGPLQEEIYVNQPPGFETKSEDGRRLYCRLNKALYGLKQAPRCWNQCFTNFLKSAGFRVAETDPCLMIKKDRTNNLEMALILYVDDGLIVGQNENQINLFVNEMKTRFETKHFSPGVFIGLEIERSECWE